MDVVPVYQRLAASILSLWLVSCSSTRHLAVAPEGADFCRNKCMQPYLDCCRLRELEPHRFTAIANAVDWLKRHREEVLAGSAIVIAGVVFVTVSAGAGTLVLVPVVMMASSSPSDRPFTARVSP